MKDSSERLLELAKALADSGSIDWEAAEAEARDDEERELVAYLRDIGRVAELQRTQSKEGERETPLAERVAPGSTWGQLEIVERLGEGASAEVFRARDPNLDRDVALKLFKHEFRMGREERLKLLLEGRHLARLRHENVVTVLGADEHGGRVGIWMELVEGQTLSQIVEAQGPRSATEATQIGVELCRALAAVHRKNLIHGDIKAQNVEREEGGRIVLMDFSSSRGAEESPRHPESDPTGTPLYMAPELWEGESASVESDVYALGVLLYYLVTAQFPVRARSIEGLRRAHAAGERHLLRDERPGLPDAFVRTVEKALNRDPRARFRSAGALEEALREPSRPVARDRSVDLAEPVLPLEVRILARAARVGAWLGAVFVVLAFLGFVTSTALNVVLGRSSEYAPESVVDWFVWGARSLLGPVYHVVSAGLPYFVLFVLLRLAIRFAPVKRRWSALVERAGAAAGRLGLDDPRSLLPLAATLGALVVAALAWWHYDLISGIYSSVGARLDPSTLFLLSPDNRGAHLAYRAHFTWVVLGLIAALLLIRRYGKSKKEPLPRLPALAMVLVILCASVLWQFPWQVLWQADFPRVRYAGETCYEVGEKEEEILLFCPLSPRSKTRVVERDDATMVRAGVVESVFDADEP